MAKKPAKVAQEKPATPAAPVVKKEQEEQPAQTAPAEKPEQEEKPNRWAAVNIKVLKDHDGLHKGQELAKPYGVAAEMVRLGLWEII